jgi:hypothetical protein
MPNSINKIKTKYSDHFMAMPEVVGIGIGLMGDKDCIVIYLDKLTKKLKNALPDELEGYPVKVEVIGEVKAL